MSKFKSALIANYKVTTQLFWKLDEDSHSELSKLLVQELGEPEEVCPIQITCGKIVINLDKKDQKPWMREFIRKQRKQILEVERKTLEWMRTNELETIDIAETQGFTIPKNSQIKYVYASYSRDCTFEGPIVAEVLDVSYTDGLVIPKGSKIERIYADNSKDLTFEGSIVADLLDVSCTEDFVIPKGSKIKEIYAGDSKNLTFEEPIVAGFLDIGNTDEFVILEGSKIRYLYAGNSKKASFEDDCEIRELYSRGSSEMIIPSTCKIGKKYV